MIQTAKAFVFVLIYIINGVTAPNTYDLINTIENIKTGAIMQSYDKNETWIDLTEFKETKKPEAYIRIEPKIETGTFKYDIVNNNFEKSIYWNVQNQLEKWVDGKWVACPLKDKLNYGNESIEMVTFAGIINTQEVDLSIYQPLTAGKYRLVKDISIGKGDGNTYKNYAEFYFT